MTPFSSVTAVLYAVMTVTRAPPMVLSIQGWCPQVAVVVAYSEKNTAYMIMSSWNNFLFVACRAKTGCFRTFLEFSFYCISVIYSNKRVDSQSFSLL